MVNKMAEMMIWLQILEFINLLGEILNIFVSLLASKDIQLTQKISIYMNMKFDDEKLNSEQKHSVLH